MLPCVTIPPDSDSIEKFDAILHERSLLLAAAFGSFPLVRDSLFRCSLETTDSQGNTPLILALWAANRASTDDDKNNHARDAIMNLIIDTMLEKQIFFDAINSDGETALTIACQKGMDATVERLIKAGAGVNVHGNLRLTPVMCAVMGGHVTTLKTVIGAHANINVQDVSGMTALAMAAECTTRRSWHRKTMVGILMDAGAALDIRDQNKRTALMHAVSTMENEDVKIAEMLLARNADMDCLDSSERSALNYALDARDGLEVAALLLSYGASTVPVERIPRSAVEMFEGNFARQQEKTLAFACGQHGRLGEVSGVRNLDRDVVGRVCMCVMATSRVPETINDDDSYEDSMQEDSE